MSPRRVPARARGPVDPERSRRARQAVLKGDAEQAGGVKLLVSIGAQVWEIGTRRPKGDYQGTRQTPGIADVKAVLPARGDRPARGLWWESKAGSGALSAPQRAFRDAVVSAGEAHIAGDIDTLIAYLCAEGYLRADMVPHYRAPKETR